MDIDLTAGTWSPSLFIVYSSLTWYTNLIFLCVNLKNGAESVSLPLMYCMSVIGYFSHWPPLVPVLCDMVPMLFETVQAILHLVLCLPLMFHVCPLGQCPEGEMDCPAIVCSCCSLYVPLMSIRQVWLFLFKVKLFVCWIFVLHSSREEAEIMGTPYQSTFSFVLVLILPKHLSCEISWKHSPHRLW